MQRARGSVKDNLTISIDIGTAQSAVAVDYVSKDGKRFVTLVDSWPGQTNDLQLARVPTALLYSSDDKLLACGAEVLPILQDNIQVDGPARYKRPQYFKVQLHPENLTLIDPRVSIPVERMYADYLRYLLAHTRSHLKRYLGFDPWVYARHTATIVFSHPNKWRSDQQRILRQAAITAGLVIPRDITTRLHFVEEGEAAASFALLDYPEMEKLLEVGTKFAVCDAGGSTVDISTYIVRSQKSEESSSMDIAELAPPVSLDAGGIYVDMGFSLYLSDFLAPHLAGDPHEYQRMIDDAMRDFERQAKRRFSTPDNAMHVKCGVRAQDIHEIGLRKGTLEIPGPIAADFFQHSAEATGTGLLEAKETGNISVVILTGGFADSVYLQQAIRQALAANPGCNVVVANHPTSKAVVVGALYLARTLEQRITIERKPRGWITWLMERFTRAKPDVI